MHAGMSAAAMREAVEALTLPLVEEPEVTTAPRVVRSSDAPTVGQIPSSRPSTSTAVGSRRVRRRGARAGAPRRDGNRGVALLAATPEPEPFDRYCRRNGTYLPKWPSNSR